jgi:hypothetical protein
MFPIGQKDTNSFKIGQKAIHHLRLGIKPISINDKNSNDFLNPNTNDDIKKVKGFLEK